MYRKFIKRLLDLILSLVAFIILIPLMIIICITIKIDSKGSVLFLQERLGKNGKIFKIIKFRTMVVNAELMGDGIRIETDNDSRITRVGKILRKTSLDELPQLINVIKGQMSIIGPRPPLTYHPHNYNEYSEKQRKRFLVRPGITGLAQVRYRNSVDWDTRIEVDVEYVEHITFFNDIEILYKTVINTLLKKNIYTAD